MSLSPAGMRYSVNVTRLKVSKEDNTFLAISLTSYPSVMRTVKHKDFLLRMKKARSLGSAMRSYKKRDSLVCKNKCLVE